MQKMTRESAGVKAGDKIIIRGAVVYARLDKPVTGEELVKENQRRQGLGMMVTKDFRSITIENPSVVQGQNTALANFYAQSIYTSKTSQKQCMSFESKSLYPPAYGHFQNGVVVEMADPQRNPAPGQIVYIMITAYGKKGYNNLGSSFDAIVFEEGPIQFYEGGGSNGLSGFGALMGKPVETLASQPTPVAPQQQFAPQGQVPPQTQPQFAPQQQQFAPQQQQFAQPQQQFAQPQQQFAQPQTNFAPQQTTPFNTPVADPTQGFAGQPQANGFGHAPVVDVASQLPNGMTGQPQQTSPFVDPNAPAANPFATTSPFGLQDGDLAGNSGQPGVNPFA